MGRCCFYTVGTLSLLLLVTSVALLVARVFQKAVDQTVQKVRRGGLSVCVGVLGGGYFEPTVPVLNLVQRTSVPGQTPLSSFSFWVGR